MRQPKPITQNYHALIHNIMTGTYQIPRFQRDFVWSKEDTARLIDSLIRGFPIGTFILWKTRERMRALKKFGGTIVYEPPEGDSVYYVLDGQQRLTSIFLAMKGIALDGPSLKKDYGQIYVDLSKNVDGEEEICSTQKPRSGVTVRELLEKSILDIASDLGENIARRVENFRMAIRSYEFSTIEVADQPLETVAEMFTRINTGGRALTLFEIMSAKMYQEGHDGKQDFDLEEEMDNLRNSFQRIGYDSLLDNPTVVLQLAAAILKNDASKKSILSLPKVEFISGWPEIEECLRLGIDKIRSYFKVPVSKLLPYPALVVSISYLFCKNGKKQPSNAQMKQIGRFFFRAVFSSRYSSSVETALNEDLEMMNAIVEGDDIDLVKKIPVHHKTKKDLVAFILENFTSGHAFDKGVLCILASKGPKRFSDNAPVMLDNSWLHIATSRNYHHFFPKSRLKKHERANSLANIVFVDDYLNKREIGSKKPSDYVAKFEEDNPKIAKALETHLISLDEDGIRDDDYDRFLANRAGRIADEILKRIR